jgi:cytochrome c
VEITMHATVLDVTPEDGSTPSGADSGEGVPAATEAAARAPAATEMVVEAAETAPNPALIAAGETVYKKCKACHAVGEGARNRVGPHLNGLFGRTAGGAEGFRYSSAMGDKGAAGLVWTPETLDAFLADPKGYVPKTKMSFRGLDDAEDRAAVAAYLSQFAP